jgi:hypothetical protein
MHMTSRQLGRSILVLSAAFTIGACDLPTAGAPKWNTTWQVPADSGEIGVASLLPSSVSISTVGADKAFDVTFAGAGTSQSLRSACPACAAANGLTVPKPAFTLADSVTILLPEDVAWADLVGGTVDYTLSHDFGFDPLAPSANGAAEKGWLVIQVRSGSAVLATDSVNGASLTLPPNVARTRSVGVDASPAAPRHVSGPITVRVTLYSPAGDPVTINDAQSFHVNVVPHGLRVSQASIFIPANTIISRQETVDLSGLGGQVSGRVQGGAVVLTVRNPFAVEGQLTATLTAPGAVPVSRDLTFPVGGLSSPPTILRVPLTADELARLMGSSNVTVAVTGNVTSPSGAVTVTPTQVFGVSTMLEIILSTTSR